MLYEMDNKNVVLMIWETNTHKRAKQLNQTNFCATDTIQLNVGDVVYIKYPDNKKSQYLIEEIQEVNKSSRTGFNYIKTKCSWQLS